MLISMKDMLSDAVSKGYAVGYFEAWDIYSLEAVAEASEELGSPVIIGFGESIANYDWYDSGGIERLAALGQVVTKESKTPMALIFNEVSSFEHAIRGIKAGYNIIMLDSVHLTYSEHFELTRQLVKIAHSVGVAVEAELGIMPMATEVDEVIEGSFTEPDVAGRFVAGTNIDALAVSIGNVHLLKEPSANINIKLLKKIHESTKVPLVVHGGSGLPDKIIPELIKYGVAKINVGTILKRLYFDALSNAIQSKSHNKNIHEVLGSRMDTDILIHGKVKMKEEVLRLMKIYNPTL